MRSLSFLMASAALALVAAPAYGQFIIVVQEGTQAITVNSGSSIGFNAPGVGQSITANFTLTYTGAASTSVMFPSPSTIFGSGNFTGGAPSATLTPGQSVKFDITYTAKTAVQDASVFTWPVNVLAKAADGTTTGSTSSVLIFNLVGTAPNLVLGQGTTNSTFLPVPNGGTVQFPDTPVNATSIVSLALINNGSGSAVINNITATGAEFSIQGIPSLPQTLGAGSQFTFTGRFVPVSVGPKTGSLQIQLMTGDYTVGLSGNAVGSALTYQITQGGVTTPLAGNQTIVIADTQVGTRKTAVIQFQNLGTLAITVNSVAVTGAGFVITDQPFLPLTLQPGQSGTVTITFAPTQPGPATGRLIIGSDTFLISSNALGALLQYSYVVAGSTVTLAAGGVITVPALAVGQTESIPVTITNNGSSPSTIVSIGVTDTFGIFRVASGPSLPLTLPPGSSTTFVIAFAPRVVGQATTALLVNDQTFTISGFATTPPPVPSFQFTGASGVQQPFTQPSIGLMLNSTYPIGLTGTLTLGVISNSFSSDPAVQFSSGGRTATFTIPANTQTAIFANGSTQVRLQTGTVAGTLNIVAAFALNGADVTPGGSPLQLVIPSAAPTLLNATLSTRSTTGLTISIAGFTTTRILNSLTFQFTPSSGSATLPAVTLDITASSKIWFQTTASQNLGGQFTLDVPFTLGNGGTVTAGTDLTKTVSAVSVTATNDVGSSNTIKVAIP